MSLVALANPLCPTPYIPSSFFSTSSEHDTTLCISSSSSSRVIILFGLIQLRLLFFGSCHLKTLLISSLPHCDSPFSSATHRTCCSCLQSRHHRRCWRFYLLYCCVRVAMGFKWASCHPRFCSRLTSVETSHTDLTIHAMLACLLMFRDHCERCCFRCRCFYSAVLTCSKVRGLSVFIYKCLCVLKRRYGLGEVYVYIFQ